MINKKTVTKQLVLLVLLYFCKHAITSGKSFGGKICSGPTWIIFDVKGFWYPRIPSLLYISKVLLWSSSYALGSPSPNNSFII